DSFYVPQIAHCAESCTTARPPTGTSRPRAADRLKAAQGSLRMPETALSIFRVGRLARGIRVVLEVRRARGRAVPALHPRRPKVMRRTAPRRGAVDPEVGVVARPCAQGASVLVRAVRDGAEAPMARRAGGGARALGRRGGGRAVRRRGGGGEERGERDVDVDVRVARGQVRDVDVRMARRPVRVDVRERDGAGRVVRARSGW
ncbi:hypothetical protein BD413DRAFT_641217, partial [Trametes elegans]